ncbi:holin [Mycobacterium phage Brocalys]|uniref:Holin n=26 Tax=Gracegardnervirinae TaxID=2946632 RepID=G1DUM6_9CAUD|nr:holin [Mycobacterium phage Tweety]YP_002241822.1 holin [Mycobacterium phage Ramsey]YP_003495172.1 holin [Mycobacterium phage Ardmore]YP_004123855.1 holin [Mycobacterium phage Wee]YP_008408991.1 holin [Mycobacterium phage Bobi]YP_009016922.1 holin [Mycobacterium phage DeadP]YP_009100144.1 holin [Mycobacterium phage Taj]YP_009125212.1 holin [Mycobacterium phage Hades]YP_009189754.1 holin [Mycobacterium phage Cabrinians]YP_009303866.1 holin [Mycobacterium phage Brocalys]YP_009591339.1 hol
MLTRSFWIDAAERAIRTFAQTAIATLGAGAVDLMTTDWISVLSVSGGAAVVSLLMSIGAERRGNPGTASATRAVTAA